MSKTLVLIFYVAFSPALQAAPSGHNSIQVESTTDSKEQKKAATYPYDSLDKTSSPLVKRIHRQWPLRSQLLFSSGFFTATDDWSQQPIEMLFFQAGVQFLTRPTYRYRFQATLLPQEGFMVNATWEYTASRKDWRP